MSEIGQTDTHQIGPLCVKHVVDIEIVLRAKLLGPRLCLLKGSPDDGTEINIHSLGEHSGMLPSPSSGADDGYLR